MTDTCSWKDPKHTIISFWPVVAIPVFAPFRVGRRIIQPEYPPRTARVPRCPWSILRSSTVVRSPTLEAHLKQAVADVRAKLGGMVQRVEWTDADSRAVIDGPGFEIRLWVDPENVFVEGDIPLLGKLLGSPVLAKLKDAVEDRFQKKLT